MNLFFSKSKRIKELEEEVLTLKRELEESQELALDTYMKLQAFEYEQEEEQFTEKCSCGGTIIPMYEEYPDWIKLCRKCDSRNESNNSPINEPV